LRAARLFSFHGKGEDGQMPMMTYMYMKKSTLEHWVLLVILAVLVIAGVVGAFFFIRDLKGK
jgi:uncharacterized protein (UPF0333 family)